MSEGKHTAHQLETLRLIAAGKVFQSKHGYGAWRISGANPSTVGKLVKAGLVLLPMWTETTATLTDAGRAAIAKATGDTP